ncbi:MAG: hypothetical protein ACE5EL_02030, partial [Anaerolineae bacterium]
MPTIDTIGSLAWLIPALTLAAFVAIVVQVAAGRGGRSAARLAVLAIAGSAVLAVATFAAAFSAGGEELAAGPFQGPRLTWTVFGTET